MNTFWFVPLYAFWCHDGNPFNRRFNRALYPNFSVQPSLGTRSLFRGPMPKRRKPVQAPSHGHIAFRRMQRLIKLVKLIIVPRHKNKEWFWGLGEVTVDRWDLLHDALCFRDEGGKPRSPGKLGARVIIFDASGGDQEGLGQTDFKKSHIHSPPQDHRNRPGHCSTAWSKNLWEASTKTKISYAPMCHLPSQTRRDESESVEGPACFSCG